MLGAIALVIAAGVLLVLQNLLMVRITSSSSTVLITLVVNSGVGLLLLLCCLLLRNGLGGISETLHAWRWWYLLPGLLGSFFVFASITGYQRLGPAVTIATLVASQLIAGLIADGLRSDSPLARLDFSSAAGVVLLVAGSFLVARGRG